MERETSRKSVFSTVLRNSQSREKKAKATDPGVGEGYSKMFHTGRLRPEVQPLTLSYTIFSEKAPLSHTFYWKNAPLSNTFLRRLMNKIVKTGSLLVLFFTQRVIN